MGFETANLTIMVAIKTRFPDSDLSKPVVTMINRRTAVSMKVFPLVIPALCTNWGC